MEEWLEYGMDQVNAILSQDPDFQQLLEQLQKAETDYLAVIKKLSPEDAERIDKYIDLCEETQYQKTFTAYYCGKQNRPPLPFPRRRISKIPWDGYR